MGSREVGHEGRLKGSRYLQRHSVLSPQSSVLAIKGVVLLILALAVLLPLVSVVAVSLASYRDIASGDLILWPRHPTLAAYRAVLGGGLVARALRVSIGVTALGTLADVAMTATLAYGLSRPGVPGRRIVLGLVLLTLVFSPGLIPNYLLVRQLGLINTYQALILPGLISAFNLVVLRNFFMSIPPEVLESARLDGASDWQVFWHITLPLSKAALAVIALFYAVGHWNDFFQATLYLNDPAKWPIQLVLRQYVLQGSALATTLDVSQNQTPPPVQAIQMATVVIATVPIVIAYPFLQRYFSEGVLSGAIKG